MSDAVDGIHRRIHPLPAIANLPEDRHAHAIGPQLAAKDIGRRLEPLTAGGRRRIPIG